MLSSIAVFLRNSINEMLSLQVDLIGKISDRLLISQKARQELLDLTQNRRKKLVFRSVF